MKASNSAGPRRAKFGMLFVIALFVLLIACEGMLSCEDEDVGFNCTSVGSLKYRK
jgi:hypothetical protein